MRRRTRGTRFTANPLRFLTHITPHFPLFKTGISLYTESSSVRLITHDKCFYHSLFSLAAPIVLQNLITFLVGFADNLMVGVLGDTAVSGVFMGSQM